MVGGWVGGGCVCEFGSILSALRMCQSHSCTCSRTNCLYIGGCSPSILDAIRGHAFARSENETRGSENTAHRLIQVTHARLSGCIQNHFKHSYAYLFLLSSSQYSAEQWFSLRSAPSFHQEPRQSPQLSPRPFKPDRHRDSGLHLALFSAEPRSQS